MVGHVATTELQSVSNNRRMTSSIMKKRMRTVVGEIPRCRHLLLVVCGSSSGPTKTKMVVYGTASVSVAVIKTAKGTGSKLKRTVETTVSLVRSSYGSRYTRSLS
jgi:hypothetical protein